MIRIEKRNDKDAILIEKLSLKREKTSSDTLSESTTISSCESSNTRDGICQSKKKYGDRFIPLRNTSDDNPLISLLMDKENTSENVNKESKKKDGSCSYKNKKRMFKFNYEQSENTRNEELVQEMTAQGLLKVNRTEKKSQKAPRKAEQVLDAPGMINDYYLNLIDWGKKNLLAVCLGDGAFLWNPSSQEGRQFYTSENPLMTPTSIAWSQTVE